MTLSNAHLVQSPVHANSADTNDVQAEMMVAPVTIIMSNFNQVQYLRESLSGLVNQSLPAQCILVIDDGSTDHSVEIIREYEKKHENLRLIRNKINLGLQDSICRALPLVDTEYLVWAASDDILLPTFLEKSMRALRQHPEAGLCFSELTVLIDETGAINPFSKEPSVAHIFNLSDLTTYMPPEAVLARMKRSYFPVSGNTVVARRESLAACGDFFKDLQWHSDHFAFNIMALRHGACVVPETLGLIRQRSDSYSAAGMQNILVQRPVLNAMLDILEQDDFADVRAAFQNAPSFYNVWGLTILRLMLKRRIFWPTAINFLRWKFQEYCWGYNITRTQATKRLTVRLIKRYLPKGLEMNVFGRKTRALQAEIEALRAERDGMAAERDRSNRLVEEVVAQREEAHAQNTHLARDMDELRSQMQGLQANVEHLGNLAATRDRTIKKNDRRIGALEKELSQSQQLAKEQAAEQAAELADLQQQNISLQTISADLVEKLSQEQKATDTLRSETRHLTDSLTEAQHDSEALRADSENLTKRLSAVMTHEGPVSELTFAPGTNVYKEGESRLAESVLITTMPKAGTYYLARLFSEGLGLRPLIVSNQYFPEDTIYQPRLREFSRGGYVSQDHFPASPINIAHLGHVTEKIVVHVRDPRQATLSYIHFLNDDMFQSNLEETNKLIFPTLPQDFFERDLSGRLDWGVDHWMPELIAWVEQWVAVGQQSTVKVKFTRYEDLVEDPATFTNGILDFLGIPKTRFTAPELELNAEVHFRKGETDEWRGVFNEQQAARANGFIPSTLSERFSWQP